VIVLTLLAVSEPRVDGPRARLDLLGAVTVTLGFTFLVYGIVGTDTRPWSSPQTVITLALGAVLLAAFGLSTFTGSLISHRLVDRIGARNQLILGTGIAAAGLIWLALTLNRWLPT
jgi:MFS family permease